VKQVIGLGLLFSVAFFVPVSLFMGVGAGLAAALLGFAVSLKYSTGG